MKNSIKAIAALAALTLSAKAASNVQITEIMYTGLFGEFVEITNVGTTDQDMTGWKFSDNHRSLTTDATSLSGIGTLSVNEVAVITEVSTTIFTQAWYTEPGKTALAPANIVSNNSVNLGRSDEVNIYPAGATDGVADFQDRVTYNDQGSGGVAGPRSEDISAKPDATLTGAGLNDSYSTWKLSGTAAGGTPNGNAWKAGVAGAPGPIGSPGVYPN